MTQVQLKINGSVYSGWESIVVSRSIEALTGRFRITATDKKPFPIPRAGACELLLEGKKIITGYIDSIDVGISATEYSLIITGRDKTADLYDCSAMVESQEMNDVSLRQIIEAVIAPFGIKGIFNEDPPEKFVKFSFQEETCFQAIERACRLRGLFANTDIDGNIIIQKYGETRAGSDLILGENVLEVNASTNEMERFSEYQVYGQQPALFGVEAVSAATPSGVAYDEGVSRYRPKIIIAEGAVDNATALKRAQWEATVGKARAQGGVVTVQGWLDANKDLWRENTLVRCKMEQARIKGDMLIKSVVFSLDSETGTTTQLSLTGAQAYQTQPNLTGGVIGFE